MRAIVLGGTGMVGSGVLLELLDDPGVEHILVIGRRSCGMESPRLEELLLDDLSRIREAGERLVPYDTCFFCVGVSSAGLTEEAYTRVTYDLTVVVAETLLELNPGLSFLYISGAGADSSERGRVMWARVRGRLENALLAMPFHQVFVFRPGFIQPVRGVRSKTGIYQGLYTLMKPVSPVLRRLFPKAVTTTRILAQVMIQVARRGYKKGILEMKDIEIVRQIDGLGGNHE